eukprot:62071_1
MGFFKEIARYCVQREDSDLWSGVLHSENEHRCNVIDNLKQMVSCDGMITNNQLDSIVVAFKTAKLQSELINILETAISCNEIFQRYHLQTILIGYAIKYGKNDRLVTTYIDKFKHFDEKLASLCCDPEVKMYEQGFSIYKKFRKFVPAINVLLYDVKDIVRAQQFALKCNNNDVWNVLKQAMSVKLPEIVEQKQEKVTIDILLPPMLFNPFTPIGFKPVAELMDIQLPDRLIEWLDTKIINVIINDEIDHIFTDCTWTALINSTVSLIIQSSNFSNTFKHKCSFALNKIIKYGIDQATESDSSLDVILTGLALCLHDAKKYNAEITQLMFKLNTLLEPINTMETFIQLTVKGEKQQDKTQKLPKYTANTNKNILNQSWQPAVNVETQLYRLYTFLLLPSLSDKFTNKNKSSIYRLCTHFDINYMSQIRLLSQRQIQQNEKIALDLSFNMYKTMSALSHTMSTIIPTYCGQYGVFTNENTILNMNSWKITFKTVDKHCKSFMLKVEKLLNENKDKTVDRIL